VDRIVVLRAQADQPGRLRVATVSRDGSLDFSLEPEGGSGAPRIYLQPCFSPSGDFVCCTEISFKVLGTEGSAKVVSMSESTHRVVVMSAFDGSVVKSIPVRKPPFFYCWSPCGKKLSMLYNGASPKSALPTVSMSAVQVVAPAGGADDDVPLAPATPGDALTDPAVSGHPVLYEFCPRDSERVVAHVGDRSEVVIASLLPGRRPRVMSYDAGSFGTPQWHPLQGDNGREVVLYVEGRVSAGDQERRRAAARMKTSAIVPEGPTAAIIAISSEEEDEDDADDDDDDDDSDDEGDVEIQLYNESAVKTQILPAVGLSKLDRVDVLKNANVTGGGEEGEEDDDEDVVVEASEEDRKIVSGEDAGLDSPVEKDDKDVEDRKSFWSTIGVEFPPPGPNNFAKVVEDAVRNGIRALGVNLPEGAIPGVSTGNTSGSKVGAVAAGADVGEQASVLSGSSGAGKGLSSEEGTDAAGAASKRLKSEPWGSKKDRDMAKLYMADVDNPEIRRCICRCSGVVSFKLSPDGSTLALLVNNPDTGMDELSLCKGDFSPDSVSSDAVAIENAEKGVFSPAVVSAGETVTATGNEVRDDDPHGEADIILSTPGTKVLAFFWSPDSSKLLFLSSVRKSTVGTCRWSTFDLKINRVARYEHFIMSAMFAHSLSFFCSYSNAMTPWSPDSDAFCYAGRALTAEEQKAGEAEDPNSQANAATLLTALMLQKKKAADSGKGVPFAACVQNVATVADVPEGSSVPRGKVIVEPPRVVMENVEMASWSQC
jgi:hypothetical protein